MKKILAIVLVAALLLSFAACSSKKTDETTTAAETTAAESDLAYIQGKGEMVIGITIFEPMDYYDANKELTGFEADFAKAVCEKLGVKAKFQEISWEAKETELRGKSIDCIWNGLTITPERQETMSITSPYMNNKQVIVTKKENVQSFAKPGALDGKTVVAEKESAGEEIVADKEYADFFGKATYVAVQDMKSALMEVKAGTADAAVIDYVTYLGTLGENSDYKDLAFVDKSFADEQYGVAFRQGSDVTAKVNEIIEQFLKNGTLKQIATKYNLVQQLVK